MFLMVAHISLGEAVRAVVDKFRSAKTQSAALKPFMPRRSRDYSTPSSSDVYACSNLLMCWIHLCFSAASKVPNMESSILLNLSGYGSS